MTVNLTFKNLTGTVLAWTRICIRIGIRIKLKCWILIRIRINVNPNPQPYFILFNIALIND
jgi:hypothetical protein